MFQTFNGWKLRGRQVMAGERGAYRNEYGDYMFHKDQTKPLHKDVEILVVYRDKNGKFKKSAY